MVIKFPHFLQEEVSDCGPTCLKTISQYYKMSYDLAFLRSIFKNNPGCTSLFNLQLAAELIGFKTLLAKFNFFEVASNMTLPCICHLHGHFVVIFKITTTHIFISDPVNSTSKVTIEEFLQNWDPERTNNEEIKYRNILLLEPVDLLKPDVKYLQIILDKITRRKTSKWYYNLQDFQKASTLIVLNRNRIAINNKDFYFFDCENISIKIKKIPHEESSLLNFLESPKTVDDVICFLRTPLNQSQNIHQQSSAEDTITKYLKKSYLRLLPDDNNFIVKISRSTLINQLIKESGYSSYLEIGVNKPSSNFDKIACQTKTGVDPLPLREDIIGLTSDQYFKSIEENKKFDIIFIDGLHHYEQVLKDIENSLNHLNEGGTIVCHDMLPDNEEMQIVPRMMESWTGDCWKAWAHLRMSDSKLNMVVIAVDHGLGIIKKGNQELFGIKKDPSEMNYDFYLKYCQQMMNVLQV